MARKKKKMQEQIAAQMPAPSAEGQPQVVVVQQKSSVLKTLLIVAVVGLCLIGGCVALIGSAADDVIKDGQAEEQKVQDAAVVSNCGVGDFGTGTATVELTNPLDEEKGFISIELNFLDASGTVIGSGTATFENLAAGQKARGEATAFDLVDDAAVASCEVADASVL